MHTPPPRAQGTGMGTASDDDGELVCRRTREPTGVTEWTFYEADLDPEERTARWITVEEGDMVPESDWR